jgi:hypothetical protein
MTIPEIDLTVYPDECDAFGHLNQASFLSLFERARWEMLARGPGMDVFTRRDTWPAVRRAVIDYHAPAFPGDVLRFAQALTPPWPHQLHHAADGPAPQRRPAHRHGRVRVRVHRPRGDGRPRCRRIWPSS